MKIGFIGILKEALAYGGIRRGSIKENWMGKQRCTVTSHRCRRYLLAVLLPRRLLA